VLNIELLLHMQHFMLQLLCHNSTTNYTWVQNPMQW